MLNLDFLSDMLLYGTVVSMVSFLCVLILTPRLIKLLTVKGEVVQDYHKAEKPSVPRPAGPAMAAGIGIAETILYLFTGDLRVLAIILTSMIAFVIGYIDDKKPMPGWFKPIALIAVCITYNSTWCSRRLSESYLWNCLYSASLCSTHINNTPHCWKYD